LAALPLDYKLSIRSEQYRWKVSSGVSVTSAPADRAQVPDLLISDSDDSVVHNREP
jgi:hypothetical protein